MKEIDPGHEFLLDSYDGDQVNRLVFMKREGEGYPFNVGHHAGTNCQEVIRALIARVKYLQKQIPCDENHGLLTHLRGALFCLEYRAARRHGRLLHIPSEQPLEVEDLPTCAGCGHIGCEGNHKSNTVVATPPTTPSAAAMRAAEEIRAQFKARFVIPSEDELAATITRHLAEAPQRSVANLQRQIDELPAACNCGYLDPRDVDRLIERHAAATTSPETPEPNDTCPRCGGSFRETGGMPVKDPLICQKCVAEIHFADTADNEGEA